MSRDVRESARAAMLVYFTRSVFQLEALRSMLMSVMSVMEIREVEISLAARCSLT